MHSRDAIELAKRAIARSRRLISTRATVASLVLLPVPLGLVAIPLALGQNAPDPVTCEGYSEKRVYLEAQSWWEKQPGPPDHPGTGKQGHIHVGTCFPLFQRLTANSVSFDLHLQFHNLPGEAFLLRVDVGDERAVRVPNFRRRCPSADCAEWIHVDVPLKSLANGGWLMFNFLSAAYTTDERIQYPITRWLAYVDNGKPALRAPNLPSAQTRIGGESWFSTAKHSGETKYAAAFIATSDFPWNPATGQFLPLRGVWRPNVQFTRDEGLALIDPALHANPPRGTMVHSGSGAWARWERLAIDTAALANGRHKLLITSCELRPQDAKNCGVIVIPFVVAN